AQAVAIADAERVLAVDGAGSGGLEADMLVPEAFAADSRVRVVPRLPGSHGDSAAAVVAPLVVQGEQVGTLIAVFDPGDRVSPEDTRVVGEAAALVAAQVELAAVAEQSERLAEAELRALRAQIS